MSRPIPFMTLEFSLKASSTIFASDAQGPGEIDVDDHGGFGIVAANISEAQLLHCWSSSFVPGKAEPISSPPSPSLDYQEAFSTPIGPSLRMDDGRSPTTSP